MKLVDIRKISHDPRSKGYLVTLKSFKDNDFIEILVGARDAKQISLAKEGISLPRPSTHDLLLDIVNNFDVKIKKIIITDYRSSIYYSKVVFHNISMGEIQVDCRPSDGMVLGLKSGAPLYVSEKLFNIPRIEEVPHGQKRKSIKLDSKISLKKLNEALSKAIIKEDYEIAAKLRDKINDISKATIKNKQFIYCIYLSLILSYALQNQMNCLRNLIYFF